MTRENRLAQIFQALAATTRVRIVQLTRGNRLCVNTLAARLGITAAATSQHLRVLRDAGLLTPVRRGYFIHYQVDETTLARWKELTGSLLGSQPEPAGKKREDKCQSKKCCPNPGPLKGKPQDCSPGQIRKCHGKSKKHPCTTRRGAARSDRGRSSV